MKARLVKNCILKAIEQGVSSENRANALGRIAIGCCVFYYIVGDTIEGIENAIVLVITLLAVGRAGEAGWASWKQTEFNAVDGILYTEWNESKTLRQSVMNFFPICTNMEIRHLFFVFHIFVNWWRNSPFSLSSICG